MKIYENSYTKFIPYPFFFINIYISTYAPFNLEYTYTLTI